MNCNYFKIIHVSMYDSKIISAFISVKILCELSWLHLSNGKIFEFSLLQPAYTSSSKAWRVIDFQLLPSELHFISLVEYPTDFLVFILTHLVF